MSAGLALVFQTASSGCLSEKSPAWEVRTNGYGSPRLATSTRTGFTVSEEGTVYAIDKEGTIKWSNDYSGRERVSPVAYKGEVIVPCTDGKLRRFKSNGEVRWSASIPVNSFTWFPPLIKEEILLFTHSQKVFRIHSGSGEILGYFELPTEPAFATKTPEAYIVGTKGGMLLRYSIVENSLQKIREFLGAVYPNVKNQNLITVSGHSVRRQTLLGEELWELRLDRTFYQPPSLGERSVFVASGGGTGTNSRLYAIELESGSVSWTKKLEGRVASSPTVTEDSVFVATDGGEILSYEKQSGERRWKYESEHTLLSKPTKLGPYVITSDQNGTVLAFNIQQ